MKAEEIIQTIMRLFGRLSALEAENEVLKRMLSEKGDDSLIPLKVATKNWECSRGWFYDLDKKYPGVIVKVSGKTCVNMGKINLLFGDPSGVPSKKKSLSSELGEGFSYPGPESNRHGRSHWCLRPTRLPVPPPGLRNSLILE